MAREVVVLFAVLQIACSTPPKLVADPYAGCVDLGDLTLTSHSREDAEQRMKAQVLELGGDTLLFGERGRQARVRVPQEIVDRRNELVTPADADGTEPRNAVSSPEQISVPPGELWYYGAALRCNQ